jgi:hypothetical protein
VIIGLGFILIGGFALYFAITGTDPVDALRRSLAGLPAPAQLPTHLEQTSLVGPGGSSPRGGGEVPPIEGGTPARNRALGKALAAPYGWATGREWTALDRRFSLESGWNHRAVNASSGAAGIPQRLPSAHPFRNEAERRRWMASPSMQIAWGLRYIRDRYGKPSNVPTSGPY